MSDPAHLTGEPLALDLVNTRPATGELLETPGDLRRWLDLEVDRHPEARNFVAAGFSGSDVAAVRELRDHVARALDRARHGRRPQDDDLEAVNRSQRAAPAITELAWNGAAVTRSRLRAGPRGAQLAAWLAEAAADLLADPAVTRIRQCEAADCVMLFLPAHPRRRWCASSRCGNRVRVARHYQRYKPA
jgi:predicted RNA-binding Zn ribbon-like protein